MAFDTREFRKALGFFSTGVTIITAVGVRGQLLGVTANSFSSVSLEPPLVLFSLDRRALSLTNFLSTEHFAVNVLAVNQIDLAKSFAIAMADKWSGVEWESWEHGCPIIKGCHAAFECAIAYTHEGGDHVIFVGEVKRFSIDENLRPLIYYRGNYRELQPHNELRSDVHSAFLRTTAR